jgi:membrane associated rhomboid family serine protease
MLLPLRTDSPLRTTPYMNWAIIAANVIVFALQKIKPSVEPAMALYANVPTLVSFITYAFLHANLLHLVGNMLFLYIFGNNVNDKMGHVGFLLFYLGGAVFSALGYLTTTHQGAIVGASGAVWAVTGDYLVLFPRAHVTVVYYFILMGRLELPSWAFVLMQAAWDVINLARETEVAHSAHLAGAFYGFGVSLALAATYLLPRDQFDLWALIKQWNRRRQYRDMVSKGYNPFGYTPAVAGGGAGGPPRAVYETPTDPRQQRINEMRAEISEAIAHHDIPLAATRYLDLRRFDPEQVLSRQAQLDVANQLSAQQLYSEAADAYETFLKAYPKFEQVEQIELMLGLIYARYLSRYDRAKECLVKASARLHGDRELQMAKAELARIEPLTTRSGPAL